MEQFKRVILDEWKKELEKKKANLKLEQKDLQEQINIYNIQIETIEHAIHRGSNELRNDSEDFRKYLGYDKIKEKRSVSINELSEKHEKYGKEIKYLNAIIKHLEFELNNS